MDNVFLSLCRFGIISIIGIFLFHAIRIVPDPISVVHAQSCQLPSQAQNVTITFPSCVGNNCNFTQGSCAWNSVSGATNYQVTVTEVETGTQVFNQQVDSSVTTQVFPVSESNTYKCSVAAVNSCGTGTAGTASLLCKVDAAVTITPTTAPTSPPVVTTFVPPKTLPVTGDTTPVVFLGIGSFILILIGITLFTI